MPLKARLFTESYCDRPNTNRSKAHVVAAGTCLTILDIGLIVLVGQLLFKILEYLIVPREHGFFCNDQSIRRAWVDHTISVPHVITGSLLVPTLMVPFVEAYFYDQQTSNEKLRKWFRSGTALVVQYIIGYFIFAVFMELGKCAFGRLRPNFLSMCQPDWSKIDCSKEDNYVATVPCTSSEHYVRVSRGSFPSGHSAAAAYGCAFVFLYLTRMHQMLSSERSFGRFKSLVIFLYVCWTLVTCVTRVTDGWHFSTDVAGGVALGVGLAYIVFGAQSTQDEVNIRIA